MNDKLKPVFCEECKHTMAAGMFSTHSCQKPTNELRRQISLILFEKYLEYDDARIATDAIMQVIDQDRQKYMHGTHLLCGSCGADVCENSNNHVCTPRKEP